MRLQILAGALALAESSVAFSDSSPWVLLSTSRFTDLADATPIQTFSQALKYTKDTLAECSTDRYLIVSQPGVNAADLLRPDHGCSMRHLCNAVEDSRIQGTYTVPEVLGQASDAGIASHIKVACAGKGKDVVVDELALASPSTDDRLAALTENDVTLAKSLEATTKGDSYTILFVAPPGEPAYESDFDEPVRMDLKRRIQDSNTRRQDNDSERDTRPLFEKYQFFTPGIFMGLITAIVLFSILGVGLRALSSLEVSYGAFDKDMGPAAQKKQQ